MNLTIPSHSISNPQHSQLPMHSNLSTVQNKAGIQLQQMNTPMQMSPQAITNSVLTSQTHPNIQQQLQMHQVQPQRQPQQQIGYQNYAYSDFGNR